MQPRIIISFFLDFIVIFDNKLSSNKSKKEGDSIAPSNLNHFMKNNLIGNEENPAIINLNVINDPNLNKYERIYLLSKNLFNTIKHDEKYIPGSFVSDDEMECDIKEKGEESSPYFPILVLKKKLEMYGIIALVERHCTQPELSKELLQMIVSGLGFLPVYEFHLKSFLVFPFPHQLIYFVLLEAQVIS